MQLDLVRETSQQATLAIAIRTRRWWVTAGLGVAEHQDFLDRLVKETWAGECLVIVFDLVAEKATELDQRPGVVGKTLQAACHHETARGVKPRENFFMPLCKKCQHGLWCAIPELELRTIVATLERSETIAVTKLRRGRKGDAHGAKTPRIRCDELTGNDLLLGNTSTRYCSSACRRRA